MFEILRLSIALIGSAVCGIWDLKTTNIPDSVAISMILIGFGIHTYEGFLTSNFTNLVNSLIFSSIFLIFSFMMYRAGQWGGGDGELLIGIAALLPMYPYIQTLFPFSVSLFINSFFVGLVYSLAFISLYIAKDVKMRKNFWKSFFHVVKKGFYRKISTKELKVDDMLGEDIPKLKLYKKILRGLTAGQVKKIRRIKKYVIVKEGIRYGPVFFLTLIATLLYGDIILLFL